MSFVGARTCGINFMAQVHIIVGDSKCQELLSLLNKWRTKPKEQCTIKELIHYRREAEQYAGSDDHVYKIQWVSLMKQHFQSVMDW